MPYKRRRSTSVRPSKRARYATKNYAVGYKTGVYKRKRYNRSKFAKAVKKVLLKTCETKYVSKSISTTNFYHDTLKGINLWDGGATTLFPPQGDSDGNRNGDEIYVTGIMIRGVFTVPYDRRNMRMRMWFVPHNTNQGDPTVQSQFMHNITGNTLLDPIQADRWKGTQYLGDFTCKSTDQLTSAGNDKTIFFKKWLPIKRKVTFKEDSSQVPVSGMKESGYLVVTQYDTVTTLTTDVLITSSEISATLYFKDP